MRRERKTRRNDGARVLIRKRLTSSRRSSSNKRKWQWQWVSERRGGTILKGGTAYVLFSASSQLHSLTQSFLLLLFLYTYTRASICIIRVCRGTKRMYIRYARKIITHCVQKPKKETDELFHDILQHTQHNTECVCVCVCCVSE